jgi:hypothetical protein
VLRVRHVSILAVAAALLSAGAADAKVRDCTTNPSDNASVSSARNMTCKAARRDLRSYRGSIRKHFDTPGGFHCSRVSGGRLAGQWRCVKGSRAYRFEFAD